MAVTALGPVDDSVVTDWVRDAYGLHLSTIEQVGHGSDVAARTWRGATADCDQYVVQVTGVGVPGGPEVLVQLSALGVRGAPAPVLSSEGRPWAERSESRLSVARWLSGSRAVEGGMTKGALASLRRAARRGARSHSVSSCRRGGGRGGP
ncbi:hypothetical protein BH24ACT8_BH24ACT8_11430 [soil metagenome]